MSCLLVVLRVHCTPSSIHKGYCRNRKWVPQMAQMPKPGPILDEMEGIAAQVQKDKEGSKETVYLGRSLKTFAAKLDDNSKVFIDAGVTADELGSVTNALTKWSESLNPDAVIGWDADRVSAQMTLLESMNKLQYLSDAEVERFNTVVDALASIRSSRRGSGNPQPRIDGRPEKVTVTIEGQDTPFTKQTGNTASSVQNIRASVLRKIKDTKPSDDEVTAISESIRKVVEDGAGKVVYAGLVIEAA